MGEDQAVYGRMQFRKNPTSAISALKKYMAVVVCDGRDWTRMVDRLALNLGDPLICPEISDEGYPNVVIPFLNEFEILFVKGPDMEPARA